MLEAQWILSVNCQVRSSPVKGEESSRSRLCQGDPHPIIQGLQHHPKGFGGFLRAKAVPPEFLKRGSDLFVQSRRTSSRINELPPSSPTPSFLVVPEVSSPSISQNEFCYIR